MRGRREPQATMLAFVDLEERVPRNHPLRVIKQFADRALAELSPVFDEMYAAGGRPSIPPERLLKASLLISLYSVRSERAFCEELDLPPAVPLVPGYESDGAELRPDRVHQEPRAAAQARCRPRSSSMRWCCQAAGLGLLSDEHFTVDGTLIEAAASLKSFRPKDEPPQPGVRRRHARAIAGSTSMARSARTRRTRARPIPKRGWPRRVRAKKLAWRTWATR